MTLQSIDCFVILILIATIDRSYKDLLNYDKTLVAKDQLNYEKTIVAKDQLDYEKTM